MRIAIAGGTGTVGAEAARELDRRGHEVRVLSRHAPVHAVDLRDGSGLAVALDGVEVVVNAANGRRSVLVEGTARLLHAAEEAGVRHFVGISIVGIDRVGGRYGRPVDDRARDAVPPVPRAAVRDEREARHRALPRVPDAAGGSARGRPRAGRDGRVRAGDAIALILVLVTVLALPVVALVVTARRRAPAEA